MRDEMRRRTFKGFLSLVLFILVNGLLGYQSIRALWHWLDLIRTAGISGPDASRAVYSLLGLLAVWIVMGTITVTLVLVTRGRNEADSVRRPRLALDKLREAIPPPARTSSAIFRR
jgi:hypothetical protein